MKKIYILQVLGACGALLFGAPQVQAQPPGDTCDDAVALTVGAGSCNFVTVSNVGATDSGIGDPSCSVYSGGDVWVQIEAPDNGSVTIETTNSGGGVTDTAIEVYQGGSCEELEVVACDDDGGTALFSRVDLAGLTPGQTLFIRAWEIGNNSFGTFNVCARTAVDCEFPSASFSIVEDCENNEFSVSVNVTSLGDAAELTITNNGGAPVINDVTATGNYVVGPFTADSPVSVVVSNEAVAGCQVASGQLVNDPCPVTVACGTPANETYCYGNNENTELVYESSTGGPLTLTFASGFIEFCCDEITIYDGVGTGGTVLYNGSGSSGNLAGVSAESTSGALTILVTSDNSGSCEDNVVLPGWSYTVTCEPLAVDCSNATEITPQITYDLSQLNESLSGAVATGLPQCNGQSDSPDRFYRYTAVASNMLIRARGQGDFDAVIEVYEDCLAAPLFCVNQSGAGANETVVVPNQEVGQEYYIRVYHNGASLPTNPNFIVAVAHIPFVQLNPVSCGATGLTTNSVIYSQVPANQFNLTNYEYEFTELEAPFNTYTIISPNGANYPFLLSWFPQVEPGRSYDVRVRTRQYLGPTWGDFGPACTITLSATPGQLAPVFNGGNFDFCDLIYATPVGGATAYRWVFTSESGSTEITTPSYNLLLSNVAGLEYNTEYQVEVFLTFNGTESPQTNPSTITIGGIPQTEVNDNLITCGSTIPLSSVVYARNLCRASSYEWRFINTSSSQDPIIYTVSSGAYNLLLSNVPGLIPGETYDVQVRGISGQQTGVYGDACSLTIEEMPMIGESETEADLSEESVEDVELDLPENGSIAQSLSMTGELWPNPSNGSEVRLTLKNLSASAQDVTVDVFDLTGKRMYSEQFANSSEAMNTILRFTKPLSNGIYLVNVTAGNGERETLKLYVE